MDRELRSGDLGKKPEPPEEGNALASVAVLVNSFSTQLE